jgi:hypothetical protein
VTINGPGGGRWIEVAPDRLTRWLDSFAQRHGGATDSAGQETVTFRGADGAVAECHVPFPPLTGRLPGRSAAAGGTDAVDTDAGYGQRIAAHACADRTVGVFLVRLGGYAAGVFTGPVPQLAASKVGSRLVHGRSAAGGTSQHRFARRREKQAAEALGAAAETAAAVFGPFAGRIDAVVLGGDRRAMAALRDDLRLAPYFGLAVERFLTVPDPRLAVLRSSPRLFRAIRIRLTGPA